MYDEPADIVRYLIIQLGLGTNPSSSSDWPVYATSEPDTPDNCITVYTTQGSLLAREMKEGVRVFQPGFQVRVRSKLETVGYTKARTILKYLTENVLRTQVTVNDTTYLVHAITSTQADVVPIGKDGSNTKRSITTFNARLSYKALN